MNFVMVREDLLPYVNKASLVMAEELMKIDSNYDRGRPCYLLRSASSIT